MRSVTENTASVTQNVQSLQSQIQSQTLKRQYADATASNLEAK